MSGLMLSHPNGWWPETLPRVAQAPTTLEPDFARVWVINRTPSGPDRLAQHLDRSSYQELDGPTNRGPG
jgi:hypothetical protein